VWTKVRGWLRNSLSLAQAMRRIMSIAGHVSRAIAVTSPAPVDGG
jgi:hypothetical protein